MMNYHIVVSQDSLESQLSSKDQHRIETNTENAAEEPVNHKWPNNVLHGTKDDSILKHGQGRPDPFSVTLSGRQQCLLMVETKIQTRLNGPVYMQQRRVHLLTTLWFSFTNWTKLTNEQETKKLPCS